PSTERRRRKARGWQSRCRRGPFRLSEPTASPADSFLCPPAWGKYCRRSARARCARRTRYLPAGPPAPDGAAPFFHRSISTSPPARRCAYRHRPHPALRLSCFNSDIFSWRYTTPSSRIAINALAILHPPSSILLSNPWTFSRPCSKRKVVSNRREIVMATTLITGLGLVGTSYAQHAITRGESVVFYDVAPRKDFLARKLGDASVTVVQRDVRD